MNNYPPHYGTPLIGVNTQKNSSGYDGFSVMTSQTNSNNIVSSYYESGRRLTNNYNKFSDEAAINYARSQLVNLEILPIRKNVEVRAPFPIDVLPRPASDLVKAIACFLDVSLELAGSCLLGAMFIATRGNFRIAVKDGWLEVLTSLTG
jgi:hypothetical protein